MNMLSLFGPWSVGGPIAKSSTESTRDYINPCLSGEQSETSLKIAPDHEAIAFDDRFRHLRANDFNDDAADLMLRLIRLIRSQKQDKRNSGLVSDLFIAWKLRKIDIDNNVNFAEDIALIENILIRYGSLK